MSASRAFVTGLLIAAASVGVVEPVQGQAPAPAAPAQAPAMPALDPALLAHRDRVFKAHFRDPMEF